jgi:hypothetical protein
LSASSRFLIAVLLLCTPPLARAATDVALVSQLSGEVTHISPGGIPRKARAFMTAQQGDRFAVAARGSLRVVYFADGREEVWTGPASFRAASAKGDRIGGREPRVAMLPPSVPRHLARVPDLIQSAKHGGNSMNGARLALSAREQAEVAEARVTYGKMRAAAASDDVTPELYLFSVLHGYSLYGELGPLVQNMLRRQPRSDDIRVLAKWARLSPP